MKLLLAILLLFLLGLMSCRHAVVQKYSFNTVRARVAENNTITIIQLTDDQRNILWIGDTVWIDLRTHTINDTSNTAMKAVIISQNDK